VRDRFQAERERLEKTYTVEVIVAPSAGTSELAIAKS
jgi:hypothetical protein